VYWSGDAHAELTVESGAFEDGVFDSSSFACYIVRRIRVRVSIRILSSRSKAAMRQWRARVECCRRTLSPLQAVQARL
jgi:hypothetical protein